VTGTYGPYRAGFAGAFIDKQVETHGVGHVLCYCISNRSDLVLPNEQLDFIDKERAKHEGRYQLLSLKRGWPNVTVQPRSGVRKVLTNMAGINRKPASTRQLRTRMGGLYCIRLCSQVEVRNLYAYAVVVPLVDMITIVARMKALQTVMSCDTIDKERGKRYARGT
jgi:hypothetical protein